jgi:hypothetical protein
MGVGSICCDQSAVTMRLGAGLASAKNALLPRSSTASRTTDCEYLFLADFFFMLADDAPKVSRGMVNLDQLRQFISHSCQPRGQWVILNYSEGFGGRLDLADLILPQNLSFGVASGQQIKNEN